MRFQSFIAKAIGVLFSVAGGKNSHHSVILSKCSGGNVTGYRLGILAVQTGFYSDVVEC